MHYNVDRLINPYHRREARDIIWDRWSTCWLDYSWS